MPERLTRANTRPGSPERAQVYAREYAQRQERSQQLGVTYGQARKLRELFPLTAETRGELKKNHRAQGQMHTQYAIIRTQIAQAQLDEGKKPSKRQRSAMKILREPLGRTNPAAELAAWYQRAYGNDYDARQFRNTPGAPRAPLPAGERTGGGGYEGSGAPERGTFRDDSGGGGGSSSYGGYDYEMEEEDLYDVDFDDFDEWDMYDFGEY